MKLPNFLKSPSRREREKRELELIQDFEDGRILHVDDNVDNKEVISKRP
jgi:hypothetical protein